MFLPERSLLGLCVLCTIYVLRFMSQAFDGCNLIALFVRRVMCAQRPRRIRGTAEDSHPRPHLGTPTLRFFLQSLFPCSIGSHTQTKYGSDQVRPQAIAGKCLLVGLIAKENGVNEIRCCVTETAGITPPLHTGQVKQTQGRASHQQSSMDDQRVALTHYSSIFVHFFGFFFTSFYGRILCCINVGNAVVHQRNGS